MKINVKKIEANPKAYASECSEAKAIKVLHTLDVAYARSEDLVSDAVYDSLRNELNRKFPKLRQKIGQKLDDDDVRLPVPMSSLDQLKLGSPQLKAALKRDYPVICTDKLDGQSVQIVYRDYVPHAAYTRGDSLFGKDVSHHLPFMKIPQKIPQRNMTVRLEALFPLKDFNKHLRRPEGIDDKTAIKIGRKYKAARNAASGCTRSFKPLPRAFKYLDFVAFQIVAGSGSDACQSVQLSLLAGMGFTVVRSFGPFGKITEKQLVAHLEKRIAKSKYEIDGVVCTYDIEPDVPTSNNPSHAFKFKMNSDADSVIVTVKAIKWQTSKYGYLTPVVTFEPTPMAGGIMCQRANGHNAFYVLNGYLKDIKDMPAVTGPIGKGAVIKIVRSGKVIPYIVEVIKPSKKPHMPDLPADSYEMDGVEFRLKSSSNDVDIRLLKGFMSSMSFKQQGSSTAKLLVEAGYKSVTDLYTKLNAKKAKAVLKDAKGKALINSLVSSGQSTDLVTWLTAVAPYNMEGAERTTFHKIADAINILDLGSSYELLDIVQAVRKIHGIDTKAEDLAKTILFALDLADACNVYLEVRKIDVTSDKLHGLVAAFSGIRDAQLKQDILSVGGAASDSLTASTTVLIVKDTGASSGKIDTAKKRGIPILTPQQFREKYLE